MFTIFLGSLVDLHGVVFFSAFRVSVLILKFIFTSFSQVRVSVTMDWHRFSLDVKHVLKDAIHLSNQNRRAYKYDLVILFARIWFLKAEIFVKKSSTPLTMSVEDFSKALHDGSGFLQQAFSPPVEESEYQISKLIEELPGQVKALYQSSDAEDLVGTRVRDLLYKFLVQVMLFKAETLLLELLQNEASLMLPLKHQIGTLREGLILLIKSDINQPKKNMEDEKMILTEFEGVATGVISLCNSFPADRVTKEAVKKMQLQLDDLFGKVQLLKAKLKELYLQIPKINFPRIPGIEFLLQNIRQLLSGKHDSVACATHQIEAICSDLEFIISRHGHAFDQGIENQECNNIHTWLVNVAYQVEYVIDSMVSQNDSAWQHLLWLYHLSEEITHIKMRLTEFHEESTYNVGVESVRQSSMPLVSQVTRPSIEEVVMVSFVMEENKIIDRLIGGTSRLDIVSIVGMGGIGKTTLARTVFRRPDVAYHFNIRAWGYVSDTYRKKELLLDVVSQITGLTDDILGTSDELDEKLFICLRRKRFLIVLDDVWSCEVWKDLRKSIPDNLNGSRILMTSRLRDVVLTFSEPYSLRLFTDDESWQLLNIKIFGREGGCPEDLLAVGKRIAQSCKGLALAVLAVAGLLVNTNKDRWEQIAERLSSEFINDPESRNKKILELSYQHLPIHLKVCFLYFGAFPVDEDIPVRKLLWLWIAEGFIHQMGHKSLEDLAEDYLMDLIGRSLVIAVKRRSNGKVKTCRVHDLVHEFCMSKARDAKFLQLISSDYEMSSSFDGLCHGLHYKQHRLFIRGDQEQFIASRPSGPYARSLLFFATTEMYTGCSSDVSFIFNNFKLLRVLDLESVNIGNSLENGIDLLVLLRYLAVGGDMDSIPSCLSKLQNLETLVVKGLMNRVVLPDTLWSMTKLRHVHVTKLAVFTLPDDKNGNYSLLYDLVTLSLPSFSYGEQTNNLIMRFPNLRKLRCIFLESRDVSMNSIRLPVLESLCHLESLNILYNGGALRNGGEWYLPSSLKKLSLSNFRMPWNHISAIGRLPNLEVLKLTSGAFEGTWWEMTEGEFLRLKYLKLDTLNLFQWDASSDHLPCLEHLELRNCQLLEKVPSEFVNIPTLQKIEVLQCVVSVEESVRRIVKEALEMGKNIVFSTAHS